MSALVIRQRFLSPSARESIDAIREHLEHRRKLTFSIYLLYAFTPLPSNYVFIAYGLTAMNMRLIAIPFFLGRSISYSFWAVSASAVMRRMSIDFPGGLPYLSVYFILSQLVLLALVYAFTRIDWRSLLNEKKFRWLSAEARASRNLQELEKRR